MLIQAETYKTAVNTVELQTGTATYQDQQSFLWWVCCGFRIVVSSNVRYLLENQLFVKRSQYIRIKNPLHKQSEKACMGF